MIFYLGTHEPSWLRRLDVPLFVSRRRLVRLGKLPVARHRWALDSGGFSELSMHGEFSVTAGVYAAEVRRFAETIGSLDWAAPQDWMCEPWIVAKTGLSVSVHQERTVRNFVTLRELLGSLVIPVLQGWTLDDYMRCCDLYEARGIRLADEPSVGLGSVCRRQATRQIGKVLDAASARGIRCHGFGVKSAGIRQYGDLLASCDSLAWSYGGRIRGTCAHKRSRCANCAHWALQWRDEVCSTRPPEMRQMALAL